MNMNVDMSQTSSSPTALHPNQRTPSLTENISFTQPSACNLITRTTSAPLPEAGITARETLKPTRTTSFEGLRGRTSETPGVAGRSSQDGTPSTPPPRSTAHCPFCGESLFTATVSTTNFHLSYLYDLLIQRDATIQLHHLAIPTDRLLTRSAQVNPNRSSHRFPICGSVMWLAQQHVCLDGEGEERFCQGANVGGQFYHTVDQTTYEVVYCRRVSSVMISSTSVPSPVVWVLIPIAVKIVSSIQ